MVPSKKTTPDIILMIITFTLLAIGLIMVYSASAVMAERNLGDSFFFAKRQMLFAGVGIAAMLFIMNLDYWIWRSWAKPIIIVCFILLVVVLIPGVGLVRNGSQDRKSNV